MLVVVLESQCVLAFLWHIYSDSSLSNSMTVRLVGLQKVFPCVALEAVLAEAFMPIKLALVMEQAVEVLDPGVVKVVHLLNQHHVDPGHIPGLLAKVVDNYITLVPPKNIDG